MPQYRVDWFGEIVEPVSDQFIDEFDTEQEAIEAGLKEAYNAGADDVEVYVEEIPES